MNNPKLHGRAGLRDNRALLLASTIFCGLLYVSALPAAAQQVQAPTSGAIKLDKVTVEGESATGPDQGIVAKRSKGASKTDTSILETPQAINVVTRDQIEEQGANSIPEALRYTPGVLSEPNGYDMRYDWLYIRGFNAYATSWLDGLPIAGDPNNYATPGINPYSLERIEVIKGPASVLYGRAVPGGLVNLVSKRPQTTPHREASIQTSGFGGIQGSVDLTGPLTDDGTWSYRFTGLAKNLGTQIDHESDKQLMLAPTVTWSPTDQTSLTVYGYFQRDRPNFSPRFYPAVGTLLPNPSGQIPRDLFLGEPDSGAFERDYFHLGYEFEHSFNETWTVRQNMRYGHSDQHMDLTLVNPAFAYGMIDTHTLNRVSALSDESLSNFAVDTQAEAKFATGMFDHTVLFGVDYAHNVSSTNFGNTGFGVAVPPLDFLNPIYGLPVPTSPITRSGLQKQDQIGLYVQDQVRYDRWVGTFGLRYDMSDINTANRMIAGSPTVATEDQKLTARAGVTYLFDNGLAPYVSYSTSFLPMLGTDATGNPFQAQTARQFEVGVKYEPLNGRGMVGISLFDMTIESGLRPVAGTLYFVQGARERVRGVEIEGKYELTSQFDLLASYAYSNSKVLASSNNPVEIGREMLRMPEHQGSVWALYRPTSSRVWP